MRRGVTIHQVANFTAAFVHFVCLYVCVHGEGVGRTIESNRRHVSPPSVTHLLLGIKGRAGVIDDQIGQNG